MPCMRLAYTVGLTCLWEVCRTWHMRCQLLPLRVRDHSLVNRALTYSIFLCFSWPIYLAKEQELDISKWYLILQEVRDSHRPHARMGPSPKAFSIWIFEKKAQRNELFFFYSPKKKKKNKKKVMGTSRRTRLHQQKIHLNTKKLEIFHRNGSPSQEPFWVFEISSIFSLIVVGVFGFFFFIISFQISLSYFILNIINLKVHLVVCYKRDTIYLIILYIYIYIYRVK